jgi:endonuclease G
MKTFLLITGLVLPLIMTAQDKCPNMDCTNAEVQAANTALSLSPRETDSLLALHLPFGKPLNMKNRDRALLVHQEFVICYDTLIHLPLWTSYLLTADWADDTRSREDCFREDPRIDPVSDQETCDYYSGSGFDRGHLSPRNDFNRSDIAMHNTCLFTNIVPQYPDHNQKTWRFVEEYINGLAVQLDSLYIITGILFDYNGDNRPDSRDALPAMGENRPLVVPSHFFKIILRKYADEEMYALAFIVPHDPISRNKLETLNYLETSCLTTVDHIEKVSGFNFFWLLQNDIEEELEGTEADGLW